LGFTVRGNVAPETVKPVPDTVAALTVTGAAPVEERTSCFVTAEFTGTLPNPRLEVLRPSADTEAPRCKAKVCFTPPMLAVIVEVCTELTGETLAVKSALFTFAGTVTEVGTTTALLLLARVT
jgi:hypothetical protein